MLVTRGETGVVGVDVVEDGASQIAVKNNKLLEEIVELYKFQEAKRKIPLPAISCFLVVGRLSPCLNPDYRFPGAILSLFSIHACQKPVPVPIQIKCGVRPSPRMERSTTCPLILPTPPIPSWRWRWAACRKTDFRPMNYVVGLEASMILG